MPRSNKPNLKTDSIYLYRQSETEGKRTNGEFVEQGREFESHEG